MALNPIYYSFGPLSWFMTVATVISLGVAAAISRRRDARGATYLLLLELAAAQWTFAIAFEIAATTVPLKLLWSQIAYLGTTTAPLFYFLFVFTYLQRPRVTGRQLAWLSIMPALTFLAAWTNDAHRWLWSEITINPANNIATYGHGPWFWLFVVYAYALLGGGLAWLILAARRLPAAYRPQLNILLAGSAIPALGNVLYVFELTPFPGVDWTPISFAASGVVLAFGLGLFRLLDLVPVARNQLVEVISDGLLVVDAYARIVDLNPAMQALIGKGPNLVGQPAAAVLGHMPDLLDLLRANHEATGEIRLESSDGRRYYDARFAPLRDARGRIGGGLVLLRDITWHKQLQENRDTLICELRAALAQVRTLTGLLPICASCKKIRDEQGAWQPLEAYVHAHSNAEFSHGICPDCAHKLYPELFPLSDARQGEGS